MVVINERDIGKTKIQVLMDLLYESTGMRIPEDKIKYGNPRKLDARPEVKLDPNTFIPVRIDWNYDDRLSRQAGFLYRRREIWMQFLTNPVPVQISFTKFPTTLHEILVEQINPQMRYPFDPSDIVDYKIDDPDTSKVKVTAKHDSFLWTDGVSLGIAPPGDEFFVLVENPYLDGFKLYGTE